MFYLIKQSKNSAFTLIETIVTTIILIVLLGSVYGIYIFGLGVWEKSIAKTELQAQARIALNFMISELRNTTRTSVQNPSPNLSIPSTPNNNSMIFYLPEKNYDNSLRIDTDGNIVWDTNNAIYYQCVPGQKQLRRLEKGEYKIFSHDVYDVQFIDIDIDPALNIYEAKIILTLNKTISKQRNVSITLTTIVALRN